MQREYQTGSKNDVNIFTDADLSVLGQAWDVYALYYKNVRKELSKVIDREFQVGYQSTIDKTTLLSTNY